MNTNVMYFLNEIRNTKFKLKPCDGTYFQLLDYSSISNKTDMEFAEYYDKGNWCCCNSNYHHFIKVEEVNHLIRICFAKTDEVLKEAATKLRNSQAKI